MITTKQSKKLRILIARLVKAEIDNSWKGGGAPEDIPIIEADLQIAGLKLDKFIDDITDVDT